MDNNDSENTFHLKVAKWYNDLKNFIGNNWKNLLVIVFFIILVFLIVGGISPSYSGKNTLDIINLLVQSEAAVIAIVITLSLVAVQLAAQSYSTRVMDIFKRSYSFWVIVILYVFSILLGISTLVLADNNLSNHILLKLILVNYYLGIASFISLIPFIWIIFDLLKPINIINNLARNIKQDEILTYIGDKENKEDPIQPIVDIIHSSCAKYDYTTLKDGLNEIDKIIDPLLDDSRKQDEILEYILDHFRRMSIIALNSHDEDSIWEITKRVYEKGEKAARKNSNEGTKNALRVLGEIGKFAAHVYEHVTMYIVAGIEHISFLALEEKNEELLRISIGYLGDIGKIAVESRFEYILDAISESITKVSEELIKKDLEGPLRHSIFALRNIGKKEINQNLDELALRIIVNLETIGRLSALKYEESVNMVIYVCDDIGKIALDKKMETIPGFIARFIPQMLSEPKSLKHEATLKNGLITLKKIAKISLEYELEPTFLMAIDSLGVIGQISVVQKMDKFVYGIADMLEKYAYSEKIEGSAEMVSAALYNISKESITHESEDITINIINHFRKIGENALKEKNEEKLNSVLSNIREIAKNAAKQKLDDSVQVASRSIEMMLKISIDKKMDSSIRMGISALDSIGKIVTEEKIEYSSLETVESLGNIGNLLAQNKENLLVLQGIKSLQKLEEMAHRNYMPQVVSKAEKAIVKILETAKENDLEDIVLFLES
jgi:hypothetical protein